MPTVLSEHEMRQEQQNENEKKYWEVLAKLDPQLYRIRLTLEETKINPDIIPRLIRSIANLAYGTGYGSARVVMVKRMVTQIRATESDSLNLSAVEEE